ncbi:hypothetical protein C4D60_Mb01t19020 [Musa balbisiana]|uniref:Uncharacterized protein n=1 Tax=Musa balbisiana TaxID=52838 RepID=A0A4S8JNH9_MUSBA|nr:hypothetical protein C4D60_Mb01t19020 [Musa balbisiana]
MPTNWREAERRKLQERKKNASAGAQSGLLQYGSGTSEILETAFKKEMIGLVTREQYVDKMVNIRSKIEDEEKEKLQKLQQGCGEFTLMLPEENHYKKKFGSGKLGKDPTVESNFLPDRREKSRSKRNENDYCDNGYISRN